MPTGWLEITTHRLDIYDEKLAKTQFLDQFEQLFLADSATSSELNQLPTAYDYIRLGHPLSCVLEWTMAQISQVKSANVISFDSKIAPVLAILRKNLLEGKKTCIYYSGDSIKFIDNESLKNIYGYQFDLVQVNDHSQITSFDGSTIFLTQIAHFGAIEQNPNVDFYVQIHPILGSVILVNGTQNESYISEIQHVRRRETIAMTPANCLIALNNLLAGTPISKDFDEVTANKSSVLASIKEITSSPTQAIVGSSGLSVQYAIMMGLIDYAQEHYPGKAIKFIVPPNCYGGTNDQARRVAACLSYVEVVDLPVDGGNDMNQSIDTVLTKVAQEDAIPLIIAEIPTNPRVEVPDLDRLISILSQERKTASGSVAIEPVFILDQTFCPNVHFLGEGAMLSTVQTISYASGSKFPSGGLCTAGYCVGNQKTALMMDKIEKHLLLCDNEATALQYEILAKQLPTMNARIQDAYKNTRDFVTFIEETLPDAKINFVSDALAQLGFTPSVFSLDLPTKGNTAEEKENYKRAMNHKLIDLMITKIPEESKYCVSYGQLKGCYWTIPATSTQGTTKEGDKDYIARVALSPKMDLEMHKKVFLEFVEGM